MPNVGSSNQCVVVCCLVRALFLALADPLSFMRVSIDGCTEIEDLRGGQGTAAKMVLVKRPLPLKGLPASATPSAQVRTCRS